MICNAIGLGTEEPHFAGKPAVGRITVSSPAIMRLLKEFNQGKPYANQIKPFSFLLTCRVKAFGHPAGANPDHFHLMAPYQPDPKQWTNMEWIDQYPRKRYRILAIGPHRTRFMARVKTYGDVLQEYEFHPESKCADADGKPCSKQTIGLLQRRDIRVGQVKYIGKESNTLEDVQSGLIHSEQSVYTEYPDPRRDEWRTKTLPALKAIPLKTLVRHCNGKISRRALIDLRAERSRPRPQNQEMLAAILTKLNERMHDPGRKT
jgi:hypothetical protein